MQNPFTSPHAIPSLEIARQDEDHIALTHANVMFLLWRGTYSPAACTAAYDLAIDLAQASGTGKVSALSIVQRTTTTPSPAARKALARLHEDQMGVIHRSALVFPNDGFVGAIIRSIALSIRQIAARRQGHDIFQSVDRALSWVTDGLPTLQDRPIPVTSLVRALGDFDVTPRAKVA